MSEANGKEGNRQLDRHKNRGKVFYITQKTMLHFSSSYGHSQLKEMQSQGFSGRGCLSLPSFLTRAGYESNPRIKPRF